MPLPFPLLFSVKRRLNIVLLEVCLGTGRRGTFEGGAIEEYQERTSWGSQETEVFGVLGMRPLNYVKSR